MAVETLLVQARLLLFDDQHGLKLICDDLIERQLDAQLQRRPKIERAPQQQTRLGGLRGIQSVQRAVVAPAAGIGRVGAERGITQLVPAERPVDEVAQGEPLGPLPAQQFGLRSSKPASSASIAALTATA